MGLILFCFYLNYWRERERERKRERERGPLFVMAALKAVTHGFVLSFMIS